MISNLERSEGEEVEKEELEKEKRRVEREDDEENVQEEEGKTKKEGMQEEEQEQNKDDVCIFELSEHEETESRDEVERKGRARQRAIKCDIQTLAAAAAQHPYHQAVWNQDMRITGLNDAQTTASSARNTQRVLHAYVCMCNVMMQACMLTNICACVHVYMCIIYVRTQVFCAHVQSY